MLCSTLDCKFLKSRDCLLPFLYLPGTWPAVKMTGLDTVSKVSSSSKSMILKSTNVQSTCTKHERTSYRVAFFLFHNARDFNDWLGCINKYHHRTSFKGSTKQKQPPTWPAIYSSNLYNSTVESHCTTATSYPHFPLGILAATLYAWIYIFLTFSFWNSCLSQLSSWNATSSKKSSLIHFQGLPPHFPQALRFLSLLNSF